ncbi:unnamed protein product [Bursaphelenchus xylophilus]|uniref:(pine wood nematode) hypothetical protein n=1 Tax=Bursaphelenchus xylophilus TaxID=6326 RepID=A0A1I7RY07_BURXY|nr:unnamed protein product [Bursaphelenchus xylophilus]CAG9085159.1 unnamed protein product [Bursaphelenchus xylophilus]
MSPLAAFSEIRKHLDHIEKGENVKENAELVNEVISEVNLFTSGKVRELVKFRFVALFERFVVKEPSSYTSALLCHSLFQVVAFEYFYEVDDSLSQWRQLESIPDAKNCLIFQLACCLLHRNEEHVLKSHVKQTLELLKYFESMENAYVHVVKSFVSAHKDIFLETFGVSLISYVLSLEPEPEINADVNKSLENESAESLNWRHLTNLYARGRVKAVIAASGNVSNIKLNDMISSLNPEDFSSDKYSYILGVIRAWVLYRPGFKFPITGKLCHLMEMEDLRTESMKLLYVITEDKSSNIMADSSFLNFCVQIIHCPSLLKQPVTEEKVTFAMAKCNLLTSIIRRYDNYLHQYGILSGYVSDLISFLFLAKKSDYDGERIVLLEHSLKFLMEALGGSKKINMDLPFIMSNNLRANRKPVLPLLTGLKHSNPFQIALLSTNLPAHEKQLFALLMKHYTQVKTRVG